MPLGILTDEQLNKELDRATPKINSDDINKIEINESARSPKIIDIKRGRGNQLEIPNEIRALVAEEVINGAPAKQVSKMFGISESSISAYKHDATSTMTYDKSNNELANKNKIIRDVISDRARGKLLCALDAITEENIGNAKVK